MKHIGNRRVAHDPFGENSPAVERTRMRVMGADFEFESNSRRLLDLVDVAYQQLPRHALAADRPRLRIALRLRNEATLAEMEEPPDMKLHSGATLLCGTMDAANFAVVAPALHSGLVTISRDMLQRPYHARYELIEFAVFTLASRAQNLVPLHAGCVGRNRRGLLLIGESGAGKSTVALHCLRSGMDFLSEDSTFVEPGSLRATGVANFLHLREDSLAFLPLQDAARIRKSPVIRRRSGIEKFEMDMRQTRFRLAPKALNLAAIVFLSKRGAPRRGPRAGGLLVSLDKAAARERLQATQSYAAGQAGWPEFLTRAASLPAFELRRGDHPSQSAAALRTILQC